MSYPLRCGNPLKQQILRECVRVCVCLFCCYSQQNRFAHCCSHCQSQITNDTNSPRALTISTLAQLTLSACVSTRTRTRTHATHSIAHTLALCGSPRSLSHTRMHGQRKGSKHDPTKPEGAADLKQVPSCSRCVSPCVRVCACKKTTKQRLSWAQLKNVSALYFSSFFCCLRLPRPSFILHMQIARAARARQRVSKRSTGKLEAQLIHCATQSQVDF